VLFEPCKELFDLTTIHGILKIRYIEINDYNKNIYSYFAKSSRLNLIKIEKKRIWIKSIIAYVCYDF